MEGPFEVAIEVEAGLEQEFPGQWQRLDTKELENIQTGYAIGWRVNIVAGSLELKDVDHLVVAIDHSFPNSQPRILAPAAGSDYSWPHVEQGGLLCLRSTKNAAPIRDRVATHINDAMELLNFPEEKRREEFAREFNSYWSLRATNISDGPRVWSLVTPGGEAREVVQFFDAQSNRYVIADNKGDLKRWLRNIGVNPGDKQIYPSWLFRISQPWMPHEFPETGDEVTKLLPTDKTVKFLEPGRRPLFLFEVDTQTGTTFAAVVLRKAEHREVMRGFRHLSHVPAAHIANFYANHPVHRCKVERVDGAWIHGRDHPSSYELVKGCKVAIIGCGSIGAAVARLLAQAGVGEQLFVDFDSMTAANVSRHPLGMSHVGFNKARALQVHLQREFPHLVFEHAFQQRFERLTTQKLDLLAGADLIVSAGIDFDGESALDNWRRGLARPPAHLSAWTEAYGAAGHAVLIYGKASILEGFDSEERPIFRLTDWPDEAGALLVEAGCGNTFQPHGIIDLHPTVVMAARLALDTLLDKVPASCRRVWMGSPAVVEENGGKVLETFTGGMTMCEFGWP